MPSTPNDDLKIDMTDDELIRYAAKCVNDFITAPNILEWRNTELKNGYRLRDGYQWEEAEYRQRQADDLPIATINCVGPIMDSVAGFEAQNRSKVNYIPRVKQAEGQKNIAQTGAEYIEKDTYAYFKDSEAFKDMLACGVGGTNTYLSYDNNPDGEPFKRRCFPGFLGWEPAAREKNVKDSNWCFEAKPISQARLAEELGLEDGQIPGSSIIPEEQFVNLFGGIRTGMNSRIRIILEFQWRKKKPFYRVSNPFNDERYINSDVIMNYAVGAMQAYGIDLQLPEFTLSPKNYRAFATDLEALGIKHKKIKLTRYAYFRALIGGGEVISKGANYCQDDFSIQFMTGKFDEAKQMYYGMTRALKEPQQMLNRAISNSATHMESVAHGGYIVEEDAASDMNAFRQTIRKARDLTVVKRDALKNGKIKEKQPSQMDQSLTELANRMETAMIRVSGVTADWMGASDTSQQSGMLYEAKVRQGLTTLSPYFDAKRFYTESSGHLYLSLTKILIETNQQFARRAGGTLDDLAAEYDIEVEECPATPNENAKMSEMLFNLSAKDPRLLPVAVEMANMPQEAKEMAMKALAPVPPPQPDPLVQRLTAAEALNKEKGALKQEADAMKTKAEAVQIVHEMNNPPKEPVEKVDKIGMAKVLGDIELGERDRDIRNEELKHKKTETGIKEREFNLKAYETLTNIELLRAKGGANADDLEDGVTALLPGGAKVKGKKEQTVEQIVEREKKAIKEIYDAKIDGLTAQMKMMGDHMKKPAPEPKAPPEKPDHTPMIASALSEIATSNRQVGSAMEKMTQTQEKIIEKLEDISKTPPTVVVQKAQEDGEVEVVVTQNRDGTKTYSKKRKK